MGDLARSCVLSSDMAVNVVDGAMGSDAKDVYAILSIVSVTGVTY